MSVAATVTVRRQPTSWRQAQVCLADLSGLRWDNISGGIQARSPQYFLYGYVWCDAIVSGDLEHSCRHGRGPHSIKVCVVKKDNPPELYERLLEHVPPKPYVEQEIRERFRRVVHAESGVVEVYRLPRKRLLKKKQWSARWVADNAELVARRDEKGKWVGPDGEKVDGRIYANQPLTNLP